MKLEKIEHKHTLTNILKVALFSLFLMLPFINILTKSLYVICNKNAKDSYYGETINENQIIFTNELEEGKQYKANFTNIQTYDDTIIRCEEITNVQASFNISDIPSDLKGFNYVLGGDNNSILIRFYTDYTNTYSKQYVIGYVNQLVNNTIIFDFITIANYTTTDTIYSYVEYNKYSYLDNVYEYAFNDLENQTWFNWTKNTPLYSGVNSMTTGLGINNNIICMILTYWLILTTIYIIIDIVINLYTLITHIINGRKAT